MIDLATARVSRAAVTLLVLGALLSRAMIAAAQHVATPAFFAPALPNETAPPPVPREFRGVWIATVENIDWPSSPGLPVDSQKAELLALLDRAASLNLNAVILQVRPAADALYESEYEPWSSYLTGTLGQAPKPHWDPLAFAVTEAHRRGLELHAWFNPYRARHRGAKGAAPRNHVSRTMPTVVKQYGPYLWMDPGEPAVQRHTLRVVLDVVKRYDIDGVHIDDYFYPYPERDRRGREIEFPDQRSWEKYRKSGGTLSREDWRRQNVDLLVEALYVAIKRAKPWVKFGVSPFGIWRPGYPESVRGLDAYNTLYADSRRWLAEGWLDYFTPQLYWSVGARQQSYPVLLDWWTSQNVHGRHLWPGNAPYKVSVGRSPWPADEIVQQIGLTRNQPGAAGNVHFSMMSLVRADKLSVRLKQGPYAVPALVPASPWLSSGNLQPPVVEHAADAEGVLVRIRPAPSSSPARWWLLRSRYVDGWRMQLVDAATPTVLLPVDGRGAPPDVVAVNAVGRSGVESGTVLLDSVATGASSLETGRRR
jgi:uncharacterized lipoprotein YddW (UPF0748 family)